MTARVKEKTRTKALKLRSERALKTEYNRVARKLRKAEGEDRANLYGAQQALAWAFKDYAMSPSKAFRAWGRK